MNKLLKIEKLTTGYRLHHGNTKILHAGISLCVDKGMLISIAGPNGSGKTTLIKTLAGLHSKLKGNIFYKNQEITNLTIKELAKTVAVVLTDKPYDHYLTAFDIIITGRYPYASLFGKPSRKDIQIVKNVAQTTNVNKFINRKFYTLSDGEKQRVMITRALAQDTPVILLDEPTAFIDSPGKVELLGLLKTITQQGKTIIMSLHDIELALSFSDELWLLGYNGYYENGTPDNLVKKGSINKIFDTENVKFDSNQKKFVPVIKNISKP